MCARTHLVRCQTRVLRHLYSFLLMKGCASNRNKESILYKTCVPSYSFATLICCSIVLLSSKTGTNQVIDQPITTTAMRYL